MTDSQYNLCLAYADRFWVKVQKTDGCWLWTGANSKNGYGSIGVGQNFWTKSHRLAWVLTHGPITGGLWVLHRCDVRQCVNPDHLYLGTIKENGRDAQERKRIAHGSNAQHAKLCDSQIVEIRHLEQSGHSQAEIARKFKVNPSSISLIVNRKTWTHVS